MSLASFLDSDLVYSFKTHPVAIAASVVALLMIAGAVFAPWVAPHHPFDLATLSLNNSLLPPGWINGGSATFPLWYR